MEGFRSLKTERIRVSGYQSFSEAREHISRYITGYYSLFRPCQYNGVLTPMSLNDYIGKTIMLWPIFVDHHTAISVVDW